MGDSPASAARVTLADIAAHTGFSRALVSIVVRNVSACGPPGTSVHSVSRGGLVINGGITATNGGVLPASMACWTPIWKGTAIRARAWSTDPAEDPTAPIVAALPLVASATTPALKCRVSGASGLMSTPPRDTAGGTSAAIGLTG